MEAGIFLVALGIVRSNTIRHSISARARGRSPPIWTPIWRMRRPRNCARRWRRWRARTACPIWRGGVSRPGLYKALGDDGNPVVRDGAFDPERDGIAAYGGALTLPISARLRDLPLSVSLERACESRDLGGKRLPQSRQRDGRLFLRRRVDLGSAQA